MAAVHQLPPRTALYLPASNPRAIEKARTLPVDLVILDLEDAVKPQDKDRARDAAVAAAAEGMGAAEIAIRINAHGTPEHGADMIAVRDSKADFVVVPKVEQVQVVHDVYSVTQRSVLAMIETPAGVLAAATIAGYQPVRGLIAGTNDLRAQLGIPAAASRSGIVLALQTIVLAARAGRSFALDGVFNALDDAEGLRQECETARSMGFDGKTLIHPNQVEIAARAFAPDEAELAAARALVEAATGGAERHRDQMIETMHVDQARALLARAGREKSGARSDSGGH